MYLNDLKFKLIIIFIIFSVKNDSIRFLRQSKKIGVIGLPHSQNVGNCLLKYAVFIKLSELGYSSYIVGKQYPNHNISFIQNVVNIRLIDNFSQINEDDYDILMVNSDQTWRKGIDNFYNIAFLKFAENWNKTKFIYSTSLGYENWKFNKSDEKIARLLLSNFTGISVREKGSVKLIEKNLGLKPQFVLDPTFLIDKKYYLNLINNYKSEIMNQINNNNYIFAYILTKSIKMKNYLSYIEKNLNIKIFYLTIFENNQVEEFIYGISKCKGVVTDSYHGTIFSIIFKNRIFDLDSIPPFSLLYQPLSVNKVKLISLKRESIHFLKKNLRKSELSLF